MGAFEHRHRDRSSRPIPALLYRLMREVPDELLPRQTGKHRISEAGQTIELRQELKIMLFELTKTETRVKDDLPP